MGEATLEHTPTWVVAGVCFVIVAISLAMERILHYLGKFLLRKGQKALSSALQKIKEELMLLGFISLLLTVFQNFILRICVSKSLSSHMLPCPNDNSIDSAQETRLDFCTKEGEVPLISVEALHQLHIFIFVLAVVHVLFFATTMVLGGAKIKRWKHWEMAIQNEVAENSTRGSGKHFTDPNHQKTFVQGRTGNFWRKAAVISWTIAFMKQFYSSVSKSDYRALRAGFIMRHFHRNETFDFHKYMMRTLEDDFKKVVGISWYLWLFVIIFLLLNVNGWHTYFWLSFLPFFLLVVVGAKLEHVITRIAQEAEAEAEAGAGAGAGAGEEAISEKREIGGPSVRPSDAHFWFGKPGIVLYLIHFILFQNSFEMAFFFWIWSTYGFNSCIMEGIQYLIPRLFIGVMIQVLCSYSTLPLYAIVTQMGDMFKESIFQDHVREPLRDWAYSGRKKKGGSTHQNSHRSFSDASSGFDEIQLVRPDPLCGEISRHDTHEQSRDLEQNI